MKYDPRTVILLGVFTLAIGATLLDLAIRYGWFVQ